MCLRKGTNVAARTPEYKDELAGMIAGFVVEAHNLAALTHKNIVHVHQVFEENDTAYMAIDYIKGMDLLERIAISSQRMTAKEIVRLTQHILPAVRYIHDKGMLHRDISPDNILIDAAGDPVLIDFGAARKNVPSSRRAVSRMKFVKDGYSPQEFYIAGAEQGPWSDVYSLAASLYHAIAGEAPEEAQKRMSALAQKQPDPYVPLAKRFKGYPAQFLETIDAALKVNPQDRVQTADDWIRRLSNRPVRVQTRGHVDYERSSGAAVKSAPVKTMRVFTKASSPDPKEKSVRKEMISNEVQAKRKRSVGVFGGMFVFVLAAAGVTGYLMNEAGFPEPITPVENTLLPSPVAETPTPQVLLNQVDSATTALPIEGLILSDKAVRDANASRAARVLSPILPDIAETAPLPRPDNLVPALIHPTIADLSVAKTGFSFAVGEGDPHAVTLPLRALPVRWVPIQSLSVPVQEADPTLDKTAPAAFVPEPATGPILPVQITGSHWDLDMPFQSKLVRVRNSHTVQIEEVAASADLLVSGEWIKSGTTIYTFNGEPLPSKTTLSTLILNTKSIDPDGFVRSTVRFKDVDAGAIDRGLLAVPIYRQITFADGTVLHARIADLKWQIVVTELGARDNGLQPDDILSGEIFTSIDFVTHEDLEDAMARLASNRFETALFEVRRGSQTIEVSVPLSRSASQ